MIAEPTIRCARDADESKVTRLLDEAFASPERESRLWSMLRAEYPAYDPALAFVAEDADGALDGALLVHPRSLWIRGVEVPCAVASPFAVHPRARGTGLGSRLVHVALEACRPRFDLVALLGEPEFFGRFGFARAFGQSRVRVRLPKDIAQHAGDGWRAIQGADLAVCRELYELAYARVSGTERRTLAALDWDSRAPHTHTLVLDRGNGLGAYARFHIASAMTVTECAARFPRDAAALLGFLARLGAEHARESCEVLVPRSHPLTRALLRCGGELTTHDMTGAVLAFCPSPQRLLARLLAHLPPSARSLVASSGEIALRLPDGPCSISAAGSELRVRSQPAPSTAELTLDPERVSGWFTGLEPLREALARGSPDSAFASAPFRALDELLPPTESFWSWSPLYDVVGW